MAEVIEATSAITTGVAAASAVVLQVEQSGWITTSVELLSTLKQICEVDSTLDLEEV